MIEIDTDIVHKTKKLMARLFICGPILGIMSASIYAGHLKTIHAWEPSTSLFHTMILFFALSLTFPAITLTVRMMYLSLVLGVKGIENTEKLGPAMERLEKLVGQAEEVVSSGRLKRVEECFHRLADFADPSVKDAPKTEAAVRFFRNKPIAVVSIGVSNADGNGEDHEGEKK